MAWVLVTSVYQLSMWLLLFHFTHTSPTVRLGSSSKTSKCMKIRKHNVDIFFERIVERWCTSLTVFGVVDVSLEQWSFLSLVFALLLHC